MLPLKFSIHNEEMSFSLVEKTLLLTLNLTWYSKVNSGKEAESEAVLLLWR